MTPELLILKELPPICQTLVLEQVIGKFVALKPLSCCVVFCFCPCGLLCCASGLWFWVGLLLCGGPTKGAAVFSFSPFDVVFLCFTLVFLVVAPCSVVWFLGEVSGLLRFGCGVRWSGCLLQWL